MTRKKKYHLAGYIFLIISFCSAYILRNNPSEESGLFLFIFVIIICISTDIGGYIVGRILKGPKLNKVSPNKTYAGMIGGFFLSVIAINIYINYSNFLYDQSINLNYHIFIYVILISLVSQIGDIIISFFKRLSKIKDTGKIIPGHGGILDRIDGMIFAIPFSCLIIL